MSFAANRHDEPPPESPLGERRTPPWTDLEVWARTHRLAADTLIVAAAVAARLVTLALCARATGVSALYLALLWDGHLYILIAAALPDVYVGATELFSLLREDAYLTCWLPLYPALIAGTHLAVSDWRLAAIGVAIATAAITALLTRRLAERLGSRGFLAGIVVALAPAGWVISSSLVSPEAPMAALTTGAALLALSGQPRAAGLMAGLATVTQKAGLLALPVVLVALGRVTHRQRLVAILWAALPPLALQLWLTVAFGDPLVNLHYAERIFGPATIEWPGLSWVRGFLHPHETLRHMRIPTALTIAFYFAAFAIAWRVRRQVGRLPLFWISTFILFFSLLSGPWPYYYLWRFLAGAAPAVACAVAALLPRRSLRWQALVAIVALSVSALLLLVPHHARSAAQLMNRAYPATYFHTFDRELLRPAVRPSGE